MLSIDLYGSRPTLLQSASLQWLCVLFIITISHLIAAGTCQTLGAHVFFITVYYKTAVAEAVMFLILIMEHTEFLLGQL